jgi:hypothetical protein
MRSSSCALGASSWMFGASPWMLEVSVLSMTILGTPTLAATVLAATSGLGFNWTRQTGGTGRDNPSAGLVLKTKLHPIITIPYASPTRTQIMHRVTTHAHGVTALKYSNIFRDTDAICRSNFRNLRYIFVLVLGLSSCLISSWTEVVMARCSTVGILMTMAPSAVSVSGEVDVEHLDL